MQDAGLRARQHEGEQRHEANLHGRHALEGPLPGHNLPPAGEDTQQGGPLNRVGRAPTAGDGQQQSAGGGAHKRAWRALLQSEKAREGSLPALYRALRL